MERESARGFSQYDRYLNSSNSLTLTLNNLLRGADHHIFLPDSIILSENALNEYFIFIKTLGLMLLI